VVRQPAERGQTVGRLIELRADRQCGGSKEQGASGMEQGAWGKEQGVKSMEQRADSRQ